jgi:HD-like signal output (HDOD) protein
MSSPDHHLHAEAVDRMVAAIGIPPCPAILARLIREARADEPDFGTFSSLISSDIALGAAMLKVANSALYGNSGSPLDSVRKAVMRIGVSNSVQLITGLMLRQAFPTGANVRLDQFWSSSSRIADLAAHIASEIGTDATDCERAHSFSLFRDCGMALMLCRYENYPRLLAVQAKLDRRLTDLEHAQYGFNHAQVGLALARSWLLNEVICQAIVHHHSPDAMRGRRTDLPAACMRLVAIGVLAERVHLMETDEAPTHELEVAVDMSLRQFRLAQPMLSQFALDAPKLESH